MKIILKFDLDNEEDKYEFDKMMQASDMALFIDDFMDYLREQVKYKENPDNFSTIFQMFLKLAKERGVNI